MNRVKSRRNFNKDKFLSYSLNNKTKHTNSKTFSNRNRTRETKHRNSLKQQQQLLVLSDRSTVNRKSERTKQTNKQHTNFFKVVISKRSIFSQNKTKRNKTSIALFHEYFIVFNFENI